MPSHPFHAVAFVENVALKEALPAFPNARIRPYGLHASLDAGGDVFFFAFGAIVFLGVTGERRQQELARITERFSLTPQIVNEEFTVQEEPHAPIGVTGGVLTLDRLTLDRAGVVALTVAQSAAMEYYEKIVDDLLARTGRHVARLEKFGTVPARTRPLHRFIGEAIGTRTEVLSVLHLLDKPDATWEDPAMDRIYDDLRSEFDLVDRYQALELKIRGVQEALEMVLEVARHRALLWLEVAIVVLIVLEIVLSLLR